ncbi:DUF305 domain-containing protein [Candidatus Planktophila dulcis]|jgi:uncharacterized protein (DUF305 family)|uniref:DUF305 domain-containing protein n=1 Tax=Candidatus Planktophila dulcis TaxID=1884914 RepID=UPI003BEF3B7C
MLKKTVLLISVISLSIFSHSASASSHASTLKNLGMSEIMFAQAMIPHHQQAIEMSNMALKNGASPEVKKLAKEIIAAQGKEISQLKYWLTATKSSMTMDHDMGMGGMLSKSDLIALKKLKSSKFDTAFLKAMIAHHEAALDMVAMVGGTKNSEAKKIAVEIRTGQSSEITLMKKLLAKSK